MTSEHPEVLDDETLPEDLAWKEGEEEFCQVFCCGRIGMAVEQPSNKACLFGIELVVSEGRVVFAECL